uniref:Uncharacterized protein n=1 Tax=Romanomermis culicivorax TaxID=13658 RepID=A0A915KHJ0_ROMCU
TPTPSNIFWKFWYHIPKFLIQHSLPQLVRPITGVSYMPASHPHLLKWASLVPAYNKLLPISEAKKKDLITMCKAKNGQFPLIPKVYHRFYEELPSSKQQKNTAPEPSTVDSDYDDDE